MPSTTFDDPALGALFRYWNDKRSGRSMPDRGDIDPLEMGGHLLPHLLLCDLLERGTRLRFRLVGTHIVKRFGFDPTGQYMQDLPEDAYFDALADLHRACFLERAPVYAESRFRWSVNRRMEVQHLVLPLTNGNRTPAISLMGLAFRSSDAFPPSLRVIAGQAQHVELRRAVLTLDEIEMPRTLRAGVV